MPRKATRPILLQRVSPVLFNAGMAALPAARHILLTLTVYKL